MKRTAGRTLIGATLLSLLCFAAWYGWTCWERSQATESTDNAYVHADITTISPKVAG
jgi:membrane fusion protein (multidrug efflux system)